MEVSPLRTIQSKCLECMASIEPKCQIIGLMVLGVQGVIPARPNSLP